MEYTLRQKIKYFMAGLFYEQSWRTTVDERNRRKVGRVLGISMFSLYGIFTSNVFQGYVGGLTNLNDTYLWMITGTIFLAISIPYGMYIYDIYKETDKIIKHFILSICFNLSLAVRWEKRK